MTTGYGPTSKLDRQRGRARRIVIAQHLRESPPLNVQDVLDGIRARRDQRTEMSAEQQGEPGTPYLPLVMPTERELFERIFSGSDRVSRRARTWLRQRDRDQAARSAVQQQSQSIAQEEKQDPATAMSPDC